MKTSIKLLLHLKCITSCVSYLKGLYVDLGRKFENLLEVDYPLWFVDLENYEPDDEISKMEETLLYEKSKVTKEGIFAYILIKDSPPNVFQRLEASINCLPY